MKRKVLTRKIIYILLALALFNLLITYFFAQTVEVESLKSLVSVLQNTSAMIFAISGIWVAYLYPSAISGLLTKEFDQSLKDKSNNSLSRLRLMVGVIVLSGFVMAGIILLMIFASLIENTNLYIENQSFFNGIGLFTILFFSEIQLFSLYSVLASSVSFIIELGNVINGKQAAKKFHVTSHLDD
ncbi:hypothetical protein [Paraglaciecola sp. L3A3]|uniref:hypothetical protein n=1 Tax=Paraglaciecola sp. L3A3 TaxID=2686358 RepID=UPI00131E4337|nr:hypothetical protein [Paraglaciecola sp. L3A3]